MQLLSEDIHELQKFGGKIAAMVERFAHMVPDNFPHPASRINVPFNAYYLAGSRGKKATLL
jgi:hypothetical protein